MYASYVRYFTALMLFPCFMFGATLQELEQRVQQLEDELQSAREDSSDLSTNFDHTMKIAGYADVEYHVVNDNGSGNSDKGFRLHNTNLFLNKQMLEKWRFYAEIAFVDGPFIAHETDAQGTHSIAGEGRIDVEATNIDFQFRSYLSTRAGRLFTPAGIWLTDHEPAFVPTQETPMHVSAIFPDSIDGLMLYGVYPIGKTFFNYNAYVSNGMGNGGDGDGNQKRALGGKAALVLPWFAFTEIGASYYKDDLNDGSVYRAQGAHLKTGIGGLHVQGEFARAENDLEGVLTRKDGYYTQAYYDLHNWTFGGRYDVYDQESTLNQIRISYFINYRIGYNIVLKLEHHSTELADAQEQRSFEHRTIASMVVYLGD